jgi:cytochrome c peroxidase
MIMPRRRLMLALAIAVTAGLTVAAERSRASSNETPGMATIVRTANKAAILKDILKGDISATIDESVTFKDSTGKVTSYQPGGATTTTDNAFFSGGITNNGRTCFTCHQPQNGWEISPPEILAQYILTRGKAALFQPIDAAVCPNAPGATSLFPDWHFVKARSQLFNRGNFRISLNAPNALGPQAPDESYMTFGGNTNPEWVLTVDYDPYGCESDSEHGLPANLISVYRRPLPATNVAFLRQDHSNLNPAKFDIMWDAREPDLLSQFINATLFHGQTDVVPDNSLVLQGTQFQSGMFTNQTYDKWAGDLTGSDGSGALGGPVNLYDWRQNSSPVCLSTFAGLECPGIKEKQTLIAPIILPDGTTLVDGSNVPKNLNVNVGTELYGSFAGPTTNNPLKEATRESIARGEKIFSKKVFIINKVAGLNDIKNDADGTEPGTCTTCHSNKNVLNDTAADPKRLGIMDNSNGVNVMPWTPDFPRFAFYCPTGSIPFFSNPVTSNECPGGATTCDKFITTDPGKGLITGKCGDLGKMKVPILHGGLASRAPYFHGGNTATLLDVVNFYDKRFDIRLTNQEKTDLVNYLSSL